METVEVRCESWPAATFSELETEAIPELEADAIVKRPRIPLGTWRDYQSHAIHTSGSHRDARASRHPDQADLGDRLCLLQQDRDCLWIADTGDNEEKRDDVAIM